MLRKSIFTLALVPGILAAVPVVAQAPASAASENPAKASLTVSVSGVRNDKGQVLIQLWTAPEGFPKQAKKGYKYVAIDANKAVNGVITTTFASLAPGTYAVSVLHDENRNGKMDTNALGVPKEGWAVSNNVVTHMHPPYTNRRASNCRRPVRRFPSPFITEPIGDRKPPMQVDKERYNP